MKFLSVFNRTFASVILYRNFRLLWLGSWTEHLGEWMETTALLWLMYQLTDSPFMTTLMVALRHLPMIVFAFIGGIVADRMNRRTLLTFCLLFSVLISLTLATLVHTGFVQPWHLLVNSILTGVATGFNHPARHTLVPNLVKKEHLLNAVTLDSGSVTASRIVGAPLAGIIIGLAGATPVLGLKAVGALTAIFWLNRIKAPPTPSESRKKSPFRSFIDGMRYVIHNKAVLTQVLLYLLPYFVTNTYTGLLPYFARNVLHVGPELYGLMNAAPGAGALVATLVLASLVNFRKKGLLLLLGGIAQGIGLILFAFSPIYALSVFLLFAIGSANNVFMTLNNTIIQEMISDDLRGRVMSLREVCFGLGPSASLISGAVAEAMGGSIAVALAGCISVVVLLAILTLVPQTRRRA